MQDMTENAVVVIIYANEAAARVHTAPCDPDIELDAMHTLDEFRQ